MTSKLVHLPEHLRVSSRRWHPAGGRTRVWRTMASWFFIMVFYYLGVSPHRLARWYLPIRGSAPTPPPGR